jgi:putative transposase
MARRPRVAPGGLAYHVMNRATVGFRLFEADGDYLAFEKCLAEARARFSMRIGPYCLMPNHFHLCLWPRADGDLSRFMQWLTMTHTQRWHANHRTVGRGHLYQSRFKSFAIELDSHYLQVGRYVERNALSANLVDAAELWRWCSLFVRREGTARMQALLDEWPVDRPADWLRRVNTPQNEKEIAAIQRSIERGMPYGSTPWQSRTAARLGFPPSSRPVGRPKKRG